MKEEEEKVGRRSGGGGGGEDEGRRRGGEEKGRRRGKEEGEVLWHIRKAIMTVEGALMRNNKCTLPGLSLFTLNMW